MRSFVADDRGIEGLPIRLVVALVVGVAALGVMMQMIGGIQGLTHEELDVRPEPEVVSPGDASVTLTVVDQSGEPISNATVVVTGGTATLSEVRTATTGEKGQASVSVSPGLGPNQDQGTLKVQIKPPASGGYTDDRDNTAILVVKN